MFDPLSNLNFENPDIHSFKELNFDPSWIKISFTHPLSFNENERMDNLDKKYL